MRPDWYIDKQDLRFVLEPLWLDRAWTFQEFVLSHHITLFSGNETISWEEFLAAIWHLPDSGHWQVLALMWLNYPRIMSILKKDALT